MVCRVSAWQLFTVSEAETAAVNSQLTASASVQPFLPTTKCRARFWRRFRIFCERAGQLADLFCVMREGRECASIR